MTQSNVGRVPAFLALADDLDVSFVHLHNPLPHAGDTEDFRRDVLHVGATEALRLLAVARTAPGAARVEVWPEIIDLDAGPPGRCMSPFVSLGVDARGRVSGCRRVDPPGDIPTDLPWPRSTGEFTWPWRSGHYPDLIAQITGDRENEHPACRVCFGNWKG